MSSILKPLLLCFAALIYLPTSAHSHFEFEEDSVLPIVYLSVVLDSGGMHDPEGKTGLANLAAHMLLRGTHRHSKAAFDEKINSLGGFLSIEVSNEGSTLQGGVLAENLQPFLDLITEAITKPKFTAEELAKLKKEVISQILEEKGNDRVLVQRNFYKFIYGSHPYANSVLGTAKTLKNISGKDVATYYTTRFGEKTIHLFGSGDAKSNVVEKWFNELTEKLHALHPDAVAPADPQSPVFKEGRHTLLVDKPKATQSQVLLGGKGLRPEDTDFYAVMLANHSFGGPSFQARMMQEIRVKRGWTYGAYNTLKFGKQLRHFAMYFFPKTSDTTPAIELSLQLFETFRDKGITQAEFDFARSSLVNNAPFNYDTSRKRLENSVNEYLMKFPKDYNKDLADNIKRVSYDSIQPALKKYFDPANLSLTVVGDGAALKPLLTKLPQFEAPHVKSYLED